jgi:hypothetical protein
VAVMVLNLFQCVLMLGSNRAGHPGQTAILARRIFL